EAHHAERERRRERHVRLGMKTGRVEKRQPRATKRTRERANEIEVREIRARPELREREAIAVRGALLDALRRRAPLRRFGFRFLDARRLRAQLDEELRALLAHRRQIAADAAVVTNELALVLLRVLEVRRVHERAGDFSARRREPALERLA